MQFNGHFWEHFPFDKTIPAIGMDREVFGGQHDALFSCPATQDTTGKLLRCGHACLLQNAVSKQQRDRFF
jgi:flavoprotein